MESTQSPRILLAGIAKDEAAYLPEWIFHHLHLGVTGVMVYVNNTTDNTAQVLDKIKQHHPVDYKVVDGIESDQSEEIMRRLGDNYLKYTPLQSKSYADIYNTTSADEYDYILFLDIDEFLCLNADLPTLTQQGLFANPVINYQWFALTGDTEPFALLDSKVRGDRDQFSKYMIKTGQRDARFFSSHIGRLKDDKTYVAPEGIVLHRVLRSKLEYLALLARSNPSTNNLSNGFKLNRRGWTDKASEQLPQAYAFIFDNSKARFEQFCQQCEVVEELNAARENVSQRGRAVKELIGTFNMQNNELGRVLAGTGVAHFNFFSWLKAELKNKLVRFLFPSLVIRHVPIMSHIKFKLGILKKDKFLD